MTDYAVAWKKWFPLIERAAGDLSRCMVDAARIEAGHRVLDLATGIGEPALTAARRAGPGGSVLGVDISAEMIAFAKARARAANLRNADFEVGDMEALAFPPETFHAVLCRWGLMFVDDLAGTLEQVFSVLRPGGRLSVSVWASADDAPTLSLAARVVRWTLGLPPPDEGKKTAFALEHVPDLVEALERAEFHEVSVEEVPVVFEFASPDEYINYRREISTSLAAVLDQQRKADRQAACRAVARAVDDYRGPEGTIRMENQAYCIAGTRP